MLKTKIGIGAIVALGAMTLGACSINNTGFIASNVIQGQNGWVVDVYGIGAGLRLVGVDTGMTIGGEKRSYLYPQKTRLVPGWSFFRAAVPDDVPVLVDAKSLGVEYMQEQLDRVAVSAGYSNELKIPFTEERREMYLKIDYMPDSPDKTYVKYCSGGTLNACED